MSGPEGKDAIVTGGTAGNGRAVAEDHLTGRVIAIAGGCTAVAAMPKTSPIHNR